MFESLEKMDKTVTVETNFKPDKNFRRENCNQDRTVALIRQPTIEGKIDDFIEPLLPTTRPTISSVKFISADAMIHLIDGQFMSKFIYYKIIDCRYSYEYMGGEFLSKFH